MRLIKALESVSFGAFPPQALEAMCAVHAVLGTEDAVAEERAEDQKPSDAEMHEGIQLEYVDEPPPEDDSDEALLAWAKCVKWPLFGNAARRAQESG